MIPSRFDDRYDPEPNGSGPSRAEAERENQPGDFDLQVRDHEYRRQDWIGALFEDEWRDDPLRA